MREYRGIAAAAGYAMGAALPFIDQEIKVIKQEILSQNIGLEIERLEKALTYLIEETQKIQEITLQKMGDDQAAIFLAHIMLLEDPEYIGGIKEKIESEAINAESAVQEVTKHFISIFESIEDDYIRERVADLKDVSRRLLKRLLNIKSTSLADIVGNVVLFAYDLTPSDTAQLDRNKVLGFVTSKGGRTSHSAIIARSMEIPAVVGLQGIVENVSPGEFVIVDGIEGIVVVDPAEDLIQRYIEKKIKFEAQQIELRKLINEPSITKDGVRVELAANIGSLHDAKCAVVNGAEGVGLYRTEFLYMSRNSLPTEEEQFQAYKAVAEMFDKSRSVVIRTLDIGGDKELSYLAMPQETNPFLGYRAIRLSLDRTEIFKTQLRAIVRASAFGNVKMMYPMIATLQELRAANLILEEVKEELAAESILFNKQMEVGIMVEIPAVAVLADQFAKEVDFFSIGTNDLIQYTMAADRMHEKVSYLYQPLNPAVLRLIQGVISAAHKEGKWVGMCGEMAGDITAIPILIGMGLDEFSMSASSILTARSLISQLNQKEMQQIAQHVLGIDNAVEIKNFVEREIPLISKLKK